MNNVDPSQILVALDKTPINSKKALTWREQKLLIFLLSEVIDSADEHVAPRRFTIPEISNLLNLDEKDNAGLLLRKITSDLLCRVIKIANENDPNSWLKFQWLSSVRYLSKDSEDNISGYDYLEIDLHPNVKSMALNYGKQLASKPLLELAGTKKMFEAKTA